MQRPLGLVLKSSPKSFERLAANVTMSPMSEREFWNERFSTPDYLFGEEPNEFLVQQSYWLDPGSKVLCIADGEGRNGVWLARQGHKVLSNDFSSAAQEKARALAEKCQVEVAFDSQSLEEFSWPSDTFDAVIGIFFQFAAPDLRSAIFAGMKRVVVPGGLVIIEGYRPEQLDYGTGGPKALDQLYTVDMLAGAFADFEILHLESIDKEVEEGKGHRGISALVDLVARKPL